MASAPALLTASTAEVGPKPEIPRSSGGHFAYLDGIRGLAALWVVIHHGWMEWNWAAFSQSPPAVPTGILWLGNGEIAVDIFIVLSGYCLMLPVLRSRDRDVRGGLLGFLRRRAKRILPPYYAALALCLLLTSLVPALRERPDLRWGVTLPITPTAVAAHLLLIQHLRSPWLYRIDYPMWSIGVEWWLYFIFALVLVPLWRRYGIAVPLSIAAVVGGAFLAAGHRVESLHGHFILLFTLGMAGACLRFEPEGSRFARLERRVPWSIAALGFVAVYLLLQTRMSPEEWGRSSRLDIAAGLASAALLVWCTQRMRASRRPALLRVLEAPVCVWLGTISYSLYLIHAPMIALVHVVLAQGGIGTPLAVAVSLLCGWLFWWLVERRTLARR